MQDLSGLFTALIWIIVAGSLVRRFTHSAREKERRRERRPSQPLNSAASSTEDAARKYRVERSGSLTQRTPTPRSQTLAPRLPGEPASKFRPFSITGQPNPIQDYAMNWFDRLTDSVETIKETPKPTVVTPVRVSSHGSMEYQSPEGECDTHPEHNRPAVGLNQQVEIPGLTLQLDRQSVLKSFVFAEVLGKPVSRRGGWARRGVGAYGH